MASSLPAYLLKMATAFGGKIPHKQEMPPRGGYPGIEFARNLPKRGVSGLAMFVGCGMVMSYGFYRVIMTNRKLRFVLFVFPLWLLSRLLKLILYNFI